MQNHHLYSSLFPSSFGMLLPERTWTSDSASYRYGFNGMEQLDEISGKGNHNTTEWRELDTRLGGRWWSPDPIVKPWESPYAGFANNPIYYIDPSGLDPSCPDCGFESGRGSDNNPIVLPDAVVRPQPPITPDPPPTTTPAPSTTPTPSTPSTTNNSTTNNNKLPVSKNTLPNVALRTQAKSVSAWNVNNAVNYLNTNALPGFGKGSCSPYVPRAINAGFGGKEVVPSSPNTKLAGSAYGPSLLKAGFVIVPVKSLGSYIPIMGDIAVMNGYPGGKTCNTGIGGPCGHIQMYNGTHWVSDFVQKRPFWPGPDYEKYKPVFKIYRWEGTNP